MERVGARVRCLTWPFTTLGKADAAIKSASERTRGFQADHPGSVVVDPINIRQ